MKSRTACFVSAAACVLVSAAGCGHGPPSEDALGTDHESLDALGRDIIGEGVEYQPSPIHPHVLGQQLNASMSERRKFGWHVAEQIVGPVNVPNLQQPIPKFMTWYDPQEVLEIFQYALKQMTPDQLAKARADANAGKKPGFSADEANGILANAIPELPGDMNAEQFAALLNQINASEKATEAAAGAGDQSGLRIGPVLVSPGYVRHVLENYGAIATCNFFSDPPSLDLMNAPSFSSCMPEFDTDAVMVKTSWIRVTDPIENYDYSPGAWTDALTSNHRPVDKTAPNLPVPGPDKIFRIVTRDGQEWALRAIHMVTKETREWVWTSLSWSSTPKEDLGSDRVGNFPPPWNNYKLTVTTNFEELDPAPYTGATGAVIPTLEAIFNWKKSKEGYAITSWGTDPHIEQDLVNSNCIGCHGGGNGTARTRKNFPSDFTFALQFTIAPAFSNALFSDTAAAGAD